VLRQSTEARSELIKTFALANSVYEDELGHEANEIPFVHTEADIDLLRKSEREI